MTCTNIAGHGKPLLFLYISQQVASICHLTCLDRRALIFFDTDMPLPMERLFQNIMSKACVRHILHHCDTGLHRSRDCSKDIEPILQNKDQLARQNMPQNNLCTAPAALAGHLDVSIHPGFVMRACCISYLECHILAATSCRRGQMLHPWSRIWCSKKAVHHL